MTWALGNIALTAAVGALIGRFVGCPTGACPLFATWKRGLVIGALIGLLNSLSQLA